jgi:MFS family permease
VLGLGAVAAGFVLASMSLTWPLVSALCSRLYLRIGFRDTALLGAIGLIPATALFLALPYRCPVWQPVALTMLMGAGFGLLSTPIVVGLQSTVVREQRGVATGSVMFARYLGQSLGAAIFGAVANATLHQRLRDAPPGVHAPRNVDQITPAIERHKLDPSTLDYLRHAMNAATAHVYLVLAGCAVLTVAALTVAPRRFPLLEAPSQ